MYNRIKTATVYYISSSVVAFQKKHLNMCLCRFFYFVEASVFCHLVQKDCWLSCRGLFDLLENTEKASKMVNSCCAINCSRRFRQKMALLFFAKYDLDELPQQSKPIAA